MARNIRNLTYSVAFVECGRSIELTFSHTVDLSDWDDPKEFAIFHAADKLAAIRAEIGMPGALPKFKTFKILRLTTPSDLGLS